MVWNRPILEQTGSTKERVSFRAKPRKAPQCFLFPQTPQPRACVYRQACKPAFGSEHAPARSDLKRECQCLSTQSALDKVRPCLLSERINRSLCRVRWTRSAVRRSAGDVGKYGPKRTSLGAARWQTARSCRRVHLQYSLQSR